MSKLATVTFAASLLFSLNAAAETTTKPFRDASGKLEMVIHRCDYVTGHKVRATCNLPANPDGGRYVLVGGGAQIEGTPEPGALLTGSYPGYLEYSPPDRFNETATWVAASREHKLVQEHKLRAFAIGLRVVGLSGTVLQQYVSYQVQSSAHAKVPSVTMNAGDYFGGRYQMIGGGGMVNDAGLFLTQSEPNGSNGGWKVSAKYQIDEVYGSVAGFMILIDPSVMRLVTPVGRVVTSCTLVSMVGSDSGYSTAIGAMNSPAGYIPTSVGATDWYKGAGRLLTQLYPNLNYDVVARSKDHIKKDSGTLIGSYCSAGFGAW